MADFTLYLITDRMQTAGRTLPAVVAEALEGGVRSVQLREKDLPPGELFELAVELRAVTRQYGALLFINDRIDVALAAEADGVHLGRASMPVRAARRILGRGMLTGYSAHGVEEALRAERDGADFVTFGPVYDTPSKRSFGPPVGTERLAEAVHSLTVPVFALGGISLSNMAGAMESGCHGVALISAIIAAEQPQAASRELLAAVGRMKSRRSTLLPLSEISLPQENQ